MAAQMYSAKQSIETVYNAARLYLYDEKDLLSYGETNFEGANLISTLRPYGIPLGFNPVTSLGQNIIFEINKQEAESVPCEEIGENSEESCSEAPEILAPVIRARLLVVPGEGVTLKDYQVAELARMIGFFAKPNGDELELVVPVDVMYTDIVLRKETDANIGFLTELNMGANDIDGIGALDAEKGLFNIEGRFSSLYIDGISTGLLDKIKINRLDADSFIFEPRAPDVAALTIAGTELNIGSDTLGPGYGDVGTIGNVGSSPLVKATESVFAKTFVQPNHPTGFTTGSECVWTVGNDLVSNDMRLNVTDNITVVKALFGTNHEGFNDIALIDNSGIKVADELIVNNVTLRDKNMREMYDEDYGTALVNLYPGGMSVLPDVNLSGIELPTGKSGVGVINNPLSERTDLLGCDYILQSYLETRSVAADYDKHSLIQAIVCNYIFWERLERRINMKLCIMSGLGCDVIK